MTKGHVPEENLRQYRNLRALYYGLESAAGKCSNLSEYADANILFAMAKKYRDKAQELRVNIPQGGSDGRRAEIPAGDQ